MKKAGFLILLVIVAITLPVLLLQFTNTTLVTNIAQAPELPPEPATTGPSLAEKVGQLFIIGHWNDTPTSETAALIADLHLGGIIVMDPDTDGRRTRSQTIAWQSAAFPSTLMIGIDQEGGIVSRLDDEVYETTSQPDITDSQTAYAVGTSRGTALSSLGINTNFSPVVDTSTNPDAFLYDRVFRDPTMIANLSDNLLRGYQNNGVLGVPKHFPGHPDTADDSHLTLPILELTPEEYKVHTKPFTDLLQAGNTYVLMTAHVQVPSLDPDFPATVSPTIIGDLRDRIGYEGVVVTDDLAMQAISDRWNYDEAAVLSLQAGADMLMLAAEPEFASSTIAAVLAAIENDTLSEERVTEAYNRVQVMKERLAN